MHLGQKEEIKVLLFADEIIIYIENFKESSQNLIKPVYQDAKTNSISIC